MPDTLDGFPFWVLEFNKDATPVDAAAVQRFPSELKSEGISDVFIFSHGWNNDQTAAKSIYQRFFAEVAKLFQDANVPKKIPGAKIGVTGVLWPSILWPDDAPTDGPQPELPRPAGGRFRGVGRRQGQGSNQEGRAERHQRDTEKNLRRRSTATADRRADGDANGAACGRRRD
jgi:hypothetical protein